MKKTIKVLLITLCSISAVFALVLIISSILYSPQYVYRGLSNGESKITDYKIFPERVIAKSSKPYTYSYDIRDSFGTSEVSCQSDNKLITQSLDSLLEQNGTTSCIVIQNDKVIYEKYFNGYDKDSVETSFSSVKSLDSLMIGIAIKDGYIGTVKQSIADYIPEFKGTQFEDITIENLLMMRSKIKYDEGFALFTDDAKTYYMPDLRDLALHHMSVDSDYSGLFHYNNYHPLLLGIILERSTGQHVADYFQNKIWDKIGAENDASWSLDSETSQFEKMESGLNFKSIDFAKIGSMILHNGKWNGYEIVRPDWLAASTIAPTSLTPTDSDSEYLNNNHVGYQYMWYSIQNEKGGHDIFAAGKYGQYLYISPENNVVIVRTGMNTGNIEWWPDVFKQIAGFAGKQFV